MKKQKTHKHTKKKEDHTYGWHIILFVTVLIIAFVILSIKSDTDGESSVSNIAGEAFSHKASVMGKSKFNGIIIEEANLETGKITRLCSDNDCNYQGCQWKNVAVIGDGCLVFAVKENQYKRYENDCAYGIVRSGKTIEPFKKSFDVFFTLGDTPAKALITDNQWRTGGSTYKCSDNMWSIV